MRENTLCIDCGTVLTSVEFERFDHDANQCVTCHAVDDPEFPIGSIVVCSSPIPHYKSDIAPRDFNAETQFVVISDPYLIRGESELVNGRRIDHPNWAAVRVVEVQRIDTARDYYSSFRKRPDDDCEMMRSYYGSSDANRKTDVKEADVADLSLLPKAVAA